MNSLKIIIAFLLISCSLTINAQNKSANTDTVKVWGNCEMCQSKIEKAAKAAGAASAKWDVDSKILSVSYNPAKSSLTKIEKSIAASGYDTEHEKATSKAYSNLPGCCQYDRKNSKD